MNFYPRQRQCGLDSLYAHDPVKFTKKGAIILKSGKKLRQPEAEVYKQFLIEKDIPILGELTGEAVADGEILSGWMIAHCRLAVAIERMMKPSAK